MSDIKSIEEKVQEFLTKYVGTFTNLQERELIKMMQQHEKDVMSQYHEQHKASSKCCGGGCKGCGGCKK